MRKTAVFLMVLFMASSLFAANYGVLVSDRWNVCNTIRLYDNGRFSFLTEEFRTISNYGLTTRLRTDISCEYGDWQPHGNGALLAFDGKGEAVLEPKIGLNGQIMIRLGDKEYPLTSLEER